jgi:hypothetical protein
VIIRHPEISVQRTGEDGNAFNVIGLVQRALRDAGVSEEEVSQSTRRRPQATTATFCRR